MLAEITGYDLVFPHRPATHFMKRLREIAEYRAGRLGFTLVELLIVIGIIALLLGILLPTLGDARRQARIVRCESNIHQLATNLTDYATENRGVYPQNVYLTSPGQYWSDADRLGSFIPTPPANVKPAETVYVCPDDPDARQSYAMNLWASSIIDNVFRTPPIRGQLWSGNVQRGAQMILVAEAWSYQGSVVTGWSAPPTIGYAGTTAAQRFGGGGGLSPLVNAGTWRWKRHRTCGPRKHRFRRWPRGTAIKRQPGRSGNWSESR
jgi:prepilin-type N-terminal cleavage/methylation domain-containing protein